MDETFAGAKKPQEIYAWAWHDVYEWNGPLVRESTGVQRYVIEFRKSDDVPYSFVVREGASGKVKFHSVKSERID